MLYVYTFLFLYLLLSEYYSWELFKHFFQFCLTALEYNPFEICASKFLDYTFN